MLRDEVEPVCRAVKAAGSRRGPSFVLTYPSETGWRTDANHSMANSVFIFQHKLEPKFVIST